MRGISDENGGDDMRYVWGWCTEKKDFRLFKLNRMDALLKEYTTFIPREVPMPNLSDEKIFPGGIKVKALFTGDSQWSA